jgi:hypothetical protein
MVLWDIKSSKIQAIASMMACMMFKDMATIKPYYVVPEKYNTILLEEKRNQETEGMRNIITLWPLTVLRWVIYRNEISLLIYLMQAVSISP